MKKIILCFYIAAIMLVSSPVLADDGAEMLYFYDFENYYTEGYGAVGPDSVWETRMSKNIRSFDTGDLNHNRVMEIKPSGRGVMAFPGQIKQGQLRISFDIKFETGKENVSVIHYAKRYSTFDDVLNNTANWYAKVLRMNDSNDGKLKYYSYLDKWDSVEYGAIDFTNWHHYDIYYSEMSDATNFAVDVYLDGKQINESHINGSNESNFWTFELTVGGTGSIFVDNLYLHRYSDAENLSINMIGSSYVAQKNGVMKLSLNDYVDESLISKENITITNKATGETVNNFDVTALSDREFKVSFDGEIEYGDYGLALSPSIIGKVFGGKCMPLEFRTEYKQFLREATYLNENFDGYVEESGILPDNFVNVNSQSTTYAKSVIGSSGEDGDRALAFDNTARTRQPIVYTRSFAQNKDAGDPFDVEFDIYADTISWYMYTTYDDECMQIQKILYNSNIGNAGYFADNSQTTATDFATSIELAPKQWHRIRMHFEPNKTTLKTKINVIFDYGTDIEKEYSFSTTVDFCNSATTGIGFGYLTSSNAANRLAIDNIKVLCSELVPYPDVVSIKLYDGQDSEITLLGNIKPEVYKAVIEFNTKIAENQGNFVLFTKDDTSVPFECETILNNSGNSEIVIKFNGLLEPLRSYNITVNEGIESIYSSDAKLITKKGISFTTRSGGEYRVSGIDADGTVGPKLTFVKSNDSVGQYIYAVAIFKDKTLTGGITIPTLVEIKYNYINFKADDNGVFVNSISSRELADGEYLKYYCVEYPSLNKFVPQADGSIK